MIMCDAICVFSEIACFLERSVQPHAVRKLNHIFLFVSCSNLQGHYPGFAE